MKSKILKNKNRRRGEILKYFLDLLKGFLAGVMIAIGGTVYLMVESKVIGAILFVIGLFIIVVNELNLFTGKIGYIINYSNSYLVEVILTLVGNFLGTLLVGSALLCTRISPVLNEKALKLVETKLTDNGWSIFILAIFCGILMYLAVNGYKTIKDSLGKYLAVFLGVSVFILSGFEHCVANMYYFTVARAWSIYSLTFMLIMILGNAVGAILFSFSEKIYKNIKVDKKTKE